MKTHTLLTTFAKLGVCTAALCLLPSCSKDQTDTVLPTLDNNIEVGMTEAAYDDEQLDAALLDPSYYDDLGSGSLALIHTAAASTTRDPSQVPAPLYGILRTWGALVGTDCVTAEPSTDGDSDGVPASWVGQFACTSSDDRDLIVDGQVTIQDLDDKVPYAGAALSFNNFSIAVTDSEGIRRVRTLNGTMRIERAAEYTLTRQLVRALLLTQPNQTTMSSSAQFDTTAVFTPSAGTSDTDPFASGTATASGTMVVTTADGQISVTRQTTDALTWSRDCRTVQSGGLGFESGTLYYDSNDGRSLSISFGGCASEGASLSKH